MSYKLNKTDGTLLVDLVDGSLDTTTTSIGLIGKNYSGFGETLNENQIKMLENFANTSAPSVPLIGQLWYDKSQGRIKVYDGTTFRESGGPIVSTSQPANLVSGDLWLNSLTNQLYFYDGTDLELAGPIYNAFQGRSGPQVVTVLDATGTSRTIVKYWVGGTLVGLWSKISFEPQNIDTIPGFTGNVVKGFNVVDTDFVFAGTATKTESLVDQQGNVRTAGQFLASDSDDSTSGALTVRNNNGLTVGLTDNHVIKVTNIGVVAENNVSGEDYTLRMTTSLGKRDSITIKSTEGRVGIFNTSPTATLDVGGDVNITGNLTVNGTTTTIDTAITEVDSLEVEGSVGIGTTNTTSVYGTNTKLSIDTTDVSAEGPIYINANKATSQGAVLTIRAEGATNSDTNTFTGIKFGSASSFDYVLGKASRSGNSYVELRRTNGNVLVQIDSTGDILPGADNTQDLGSSSKRFANLYTGDLNLSNEGSANDVDGTWGSYVIQEGEDDLFLINRRTGKKYKFNLTEV